LQSAMPTLGAATLVRVECAVNSRDGVKFVPAIAANSMAASVGYTAANFGEVAAVAIRAATAPGFDT